jgi:uncharacterized membrane protein YccC
MATSKALIGLVANALFAGIVWILIEKAGISLIENSTKLYILAVIPAVLFMWYCMKKKGCVKMGIGALLNIIVFVALFFITGNTLTD